VQRVDGGFIYSASDLNNDLECRRLTWLEYQLSVGLLGRPEQGAAAGLIANKGAAHEARYRDALLAEHGDRMVMFEPRVASTLDAYRAADAQTLTAMASGAPVIYQATFFDGTFLGRTDFLRRVETPSARWAWSYEVIDTKLALQPKAYFILQLCNYSEHVERLQGTAPAHAHLVLGSGIEEPIRIADYAAYYRHQKQQFLARIAHPADTYPVEIAHCTICRWADLCEAKREADDYLGIVAGMRADQIERLNASGIATIGALSAATPEQRPHGMIETSYEKLRAQATLQHKQRTAIRANVDGAPRHFYELLEHDPECGFEMLPRPDDGDVYFDMEGDPLYTPERGLEYLFGVYLAKENAYRPFWALDIAKERGAFEAFIDFIVERRKHYPNLHVYHYAQYETVALRRLMGEFGSREAELDTLLRGQVFVDLFAVVRQAIRISQPSYSIKKLEPFYGMVRTTDVKRGDDSIVNFERWLNNNDQSILDDIEKYNQDDCYSTWLLHEWLLTLRLERGQQAQRELPWREAPAPTPLDEPTPADDLAARLLAGLPDFRFASELLDAAEDVRARWLLAHLLQYHRREAKPAYWKLFDRYDNVDRLAEFDNEAIGDMTWCADVAPFKLSARDQNLVYTFNFPDQTHKLSRGDAHSPHAKKRIGEIVRIDDERNRIQVKLAKAVAPVTVKALIPGGPLNTNVQRDALNRFALAYENGTIATRYPAAWDLLLRRLPRLTGRSPHAVIQPDAVTAPAVAELVHALDGSYLFIQGPPGSGKTTLGGEVLVMLLAAGKRVGIVSRSHSAIHHLLHDVEKVARARGVTFAGLYRETNDDSAYVSPLERPMIVNTTEIDDFVARPHDLAGGTSWLFAREELAQKYDVLFIEEAGTIALGDAIACAMAAKNVVLLGDPLQLAQVSQGSHPIGTGPSVLEHLLGDHDTVPPDRGVFLDVSYRMHPEICSFISRTVYEGRLHSAAEAAHNRVSAGSLTGSGLRFVPVVHRGNGRASIEEAERIADAIAELLRGAVTVGIKPMRKLEAADILVVTPYNAQRHRIDRTLAERGLPPIAAGTVDKFQGQQAPVVFYSMATSSAADLPRDMSFLFEKNRFNVAISRAQCLSVLVCSPELLEVRCATLQEMRLASLLCAFVEHATAPPSELVLH
jgi:predicted RecB family nuclease